MAEEILVVGGGFAGLAAGVALAEAGRRVRLLEQSQHWGGRARSFRDAVTGMALDNGQHLLLGCYHRTLRFLDTLGTLERIRFQPQMTLHFMERGGCLSVLRCRNLPAPWHLFAGVLASDAFSWREKREVLRLGRSLQKSAGISLDRAEPPLEKMTVGEWLQCLGQSDRVQRNFWDLLCIAAMNEDPEVASADIFARVLSRALLQSPADSRIGIPAAGLSDCYAETAASFLFAHGGVVELGKSVAGLRVKGDQVTGVYLADGKILEATKLICAVPWHGLLRWLPPSLAAHPFFARIAKLKPAPIVSVYCWFDRPITHLDFVGLRGTTFQWLFNKNKILAESALGASDPKLFLVSLVLSGAHAHLQRTREDLAGTALRELGEVFPEARAAHLVRSLVIKEPWATFSPAPGVEALRPACRTPLQGFYLAGDWTATGLPATIEGAVESGYTAADAVLQEA